MIYTVTMIDSFKNEQNAKFSSPVSNTKGIYWMPDDSWIAGFFTDLAEAIRVVKENVTDIFEHCYNYAVVEGYEEGLYPRPELTRWLNMMLRVTQHSRLNRRCIIRWPDMRFEEGE